MNDTTLALLRVSRITYQIHPNQNNAILIALRLQFLIIVKLKKKKKKKKVLKSFIKEKKIIINLPNLVWLI